MVSEDWNLVREGEEKKRRGEKRMSEGVKKARGEEGKRRREGVQREGGRVFEQVGKESKRGRGVRIRMEERRGKSYIGQCKEERAGKEE